MPRNSRKRVPREIINSIIENELRDPTEKLPPTACAIELNIPPATYRGITKRLRAQGKLPPIETLATIDIGTATSGTEFAEKAAERADERLLALIAAGQADVSPEQEDAVLRAIIMTGTENGKMRAIQIRQERRLATGGHLGPPAPTTLDQQIDRAALILATFDPETITTILDRASLMRPTPPNLTVQPLSPPPEPLPPRVDAPPSA